MQESREKAYAKINLTLDVTGRREDGYHLVKMVMQTIGLCDEVLVRLEEKPGVRLAINLPFLPTDDRNLAVKAAKVFLQEIGQPEQGVFIRIEKNIPVAAGLAGGSTNAAAVLRQLNELTGANLPPEKLEELGLKLGADVPYCLWGGTKLAEGIGEKLSALPPMMPCFVVLCKPPFSVSTAAVYQKIDSCRLNHRPDTAGLCQALAQGDYNGVVHRLYNVMEELTGAEHREIKEIRDVLLEAGADGAVMSGSGPTVYGLFRQKAAAYQAKELLSQSYRDVFLTEIR